MGGHHGSKQQAYWLKLQMLAHISERQTGSTERTLRRVGGFWNLEPIPRGTLLRTRPNLILREPRTGSDKVLRCHRLMRGSASKHHIVGNWERSWEESEGGWVQSKDTIDNSHRTDEMGGKDHLVRCELRPWCMQSPWRHDCCNSACDILTMPQIFLCLPMKLKSVPKRWAWVYWFLHLFIFFIY